MINLNSEYSNNSKTALGELASKTRPITPNTTPTTTNKASTSTDTSKLQQLNSDNNSPTVFHNHFDWLTINFEGLTKLDFDNLINLIGKELVALEEGKSWSSGERAKNYSNTIHSPIGLKGAYSSYKTENDVDTHHDVTISLSGQYFSSSTSIEQWKLCRDLFTKYQAKCSRIDTSIDDYSFKNIPIDKMKEAYRRGDYFDFKTYHHETDEANPNNPITTHYFGAEGSKKLARVYNHKNESLRLETQFRGKYAQVAFQAIAILKRDDETDEEWTKIIQKTIGGIAIGTMDFRGRSHLKNPKKRGFCLPFRSTKSISCVSSL